MKWFIVSILILVLLSTPSLAFEDEKIPVILIFGWGEEKGAFTVKSGEDRGYLMRTLAQEMKKGKVEDLKELWIINGVAMRASPQTIEELKKRPEVLRIIPDLKVRLLEAETSTATSESEISWNLEMIDAPEIWKLGINGTCVNVSIIDTGVDASHSEIAGKVVAWRDLVNGMSSPYDDHGHGTHVAGIIAGETVGVAPGASLIAVKVFDSGGLANTSDVIEGFQWAVENGADVISYSGGLLPFEEVLSGSYSIPLNSTSCHNFTVKAFKYEEAFKPSSIIVEIESLDAENLSVSLISPSGKVFGDVHKEGNNLILRYSGDEPLSEGLWSLRISSLRAENHVWFSGKGINLNNTLSRSFNLSNVESANLRFRTSYDIQSNFDTGDIQVIFENETHTLLSLAGTSDWRQITVNLSEFCGNEITVVFRYQTTSPVSNGWMLDDIEIPEIGFHDDAENESQWNSSGWTRVAEEISYGLSVSVLYPSNGSSLIDEVVNNISSIGIPVIVAAGNDGDFGFRTINSPGSAKEAITVGATEEMSSEIASFSSRGPVGFGEDVRVKPDVVAPGENIRSAYPGGGYVLMSGTSMATPHVSGIVAMILQVNRSLSPSEIRDILERTSMDLGDPEKDNVYGSGMVNAYYAVLNSTKKGDVTLDGKVEMNDAVMIAQMVIGKISGNPLGDLNGNGRVDIGDLAKIVYCILGKL